MNGPNKAGASDSRVFKKNGLKAKLRDSNKMGIADGGYSGHSAQLSTPNGHDSKVVKTFKGRALKRHEKFNGLIKAFDSMSGRFRHSVEKFAMSFEAICALCQFQVECNAPLHEMLLEHMTTTDVEAPDADGWI